MDKKHVCKHYNLKAVECERKKRLSCLALPVMSILTVTQGKKKINFQACPCSCCNFDVLVEPKSKSHSRDKTSLHAAWCPEPLLNITMDHICLDIK